jgi:hypothetical protein
MVGVIGGPWGFRGPMVGWRGRFRRFEPNPSWARPAQYIRVHPMAAPVPRLTPAIRSGTTMESPVVTTRQHPNPKPNRRLSMDRTQFRAPSLRVSPLALIRSAHDLTTIEHRLTVFEHRKSRRYHAGRAARGAHPDDWTRWRSPCAGLSMTHYVNFQLISYIACYTLQAGLHSEGGGGRG